MHLAGPLDRNRYLAGKAVAVVAVMLLITLGPLLFMLAAFVLAGHGPEAVDMPALLLRMLASGVVTRSFLRLAVDGGLELDDRRAAASRRFSSSSCR